MATCLQGLGHVAHGFQLQISLRYGLNGGRAAALRFHIDGEGTANGQQQERGIPWI